MARRAARFSLLVAIGLALLVAVLAGHKVLSSRGEGRAHAPRPEQRPAAESPLDSPAGAPSVDAGTSDRERILAWAARHRGSVSFDPVEWFLEDTPDERTWHDGTAGLPTAEIVAAHLLTDDLDAALADLPTGATIPVLKLGNGTPTPHNMANLTRLRGLRGLHVGQPVSDAVMAVIGNLRKLEWLLVGGEAITDSSLLHLGRLPALRHLGMIGVRVRGESGASFALPDTLEALYVTTRHGLDDTFVTALPPLPSLKELHLPEVWVTDAALPRIGTFGSLEELDLKSNHLSDATITQLAGLQRLRKLDLSGNSVTDRGFATIAGLAALEDLALRGTAVAALPGIEKLTRLRSLNLRSSSVTNEGLGRLAPLKQLERLNLCNTTITDADLPCLAALSGLRGLSLAETKVTSAGLAHLQGLGSLEELDLWRTSVGDDGISYLAALGSLRTLDVIETRVSPDGLLALKDLPLRSVRMNRIAEADVTRLNAAMPDCSFVR